MYKLGSNFIMSLLLTKEEVRELTSRQRRTAQAAALRHMGIDHLVRADGSVAVLRSHAEKLLTGVGGKNASKSAAEPNWELI